MELLVKRIYEGTASAQTTADCTNGFNTELKQKLVTNWTGSLSLINSKYIASLHSAENIINSYKQDFIRNFISNQVPRKTKRKNHLKQRSVINFQDRTREKTSTYIDIIAVVARGAGTDNTWVLHWIRARFTGSHHWQTK